MTLAAAIDAAVEAQGFSGVVSIRQDGEVRYQRAARYADRSNRIPNRPDTRFAIASGTKFFTALAIGKLIEGGKLSFDTRLKDCLDLDFLHYPDAIAVRHLLTHTSGIPDYYDEEKITDFDNFTVSVPWYELRGPRDYLPVFPDEPMKFPPGSRFSYSNGGYILLGVIVEELTGRPYREFVETEVLQPAGMARSGFFAANRLPENTAFGYVQDEEGWRTNVFNLPIVGASDGGAYTTAGDLAILWEAFWSGKILSQELVDLFTTPFVKVAEDGSNRYYGHGLWLRDGGDGGREVYIVGADAGVSMKSGVNRKTGLQITVLSNTSEGAWPVLREVAEALKGA